jgi:hypothetical protein
VAPLSIINLLYKEIVIEFKVIPHYFSDFSNFVEPTAQLVDEEVASFDLDFIGRTTLMFSLNLLF